MNRKPEEISNILKEQIRNYKNRIDMGEVGTVVMVGDGIASVYGIRNCMSTELLEFEDGSVGLAQNLEEETVIRRDKCVWQLKVLSEMDEEGLLRDLERVRQSEILSQKQQLVVNPGLQIGETYVIKNGPFKGQEVILVRRKDAVSVVVNLFFLGRNIEFMCGADELVL